MSAAAAPFFTKRISVASPSRFVFDVRTRNRRGGLDIAPLQRGGFGTAQPRVKQNTGDGSVDLRCARQYPEPPFRQRHAPRRHPPVPLEVLPAHRHYRISHSGNHCQQ